MTDPPQRVVPRLPYRQKPPPRTSDPAVTLRIVDSPCSSLSLKPRLFSLPSRLLLFLSPLFLNLTGYWGCFWLVLVVSPIELLLSLSFPLFPVPDCIYAVHSHYFLLAYNSTPHSCLVLFTLSVSTLNSTSPVQKCSASTYIISGGLCGTCRLLAPIEGLRAIGLLVEASCLTLKTIHPTFPVLHLQQQRTRPPATLAVPA